MEIIIVKFYLASYLLIILWCKYYSLMTHIFIYKYNKYFSRRIQSSGFWFKPCHQHLFPRETRQSCRIWDNGYGTRPSVYASSNQQADGCIRDYGYIAYTRRSVLAFDRGSSALTTSEMAYETKGNHSSSDGKWERRRRSWWVDKVRKPETVSRLLPSVNINITSFLSDLRVARLWGEIYRKCK